MVILELATQQRRWDDLQSPILFPDTENEVMEEQKEV